MLKGEACMLRIKCPSKQRTSHMSSQWQNFMLRAPWLHTHAGGSCAEFLTFLPVQPSQSCVVLLIHLWTRGPGLKGLRVSPEVPNKQGQGVDLSRVRPTLKPTLSTQPTPLRRDPCQAQTHHTFTPEGQREASLPEAVYLQSCFPSLKGYCTP